MKTIQIDEEGYFASSGVRLTDEKYCSRLLSTLTCEGRAFYVSDNDMRVLVEAFDEPLVVRHIVNISPDGVVHGTLPYSLPVSLTLESFRVDLWDRFHARTGNPSREGENLSANLPAVLSRSAQMELFDLADEFDDDSLTYHGRRFAVLPLATAEQPVSSSQFWSDIYSQWQAESGDPSGEQKQEQKHVQKPGWELGAPAEPLKAVLPQIKIPKSRICVLGSGSGHDAAYFAGQGHVATGVDFSEAAIERARKQYSPSEPSGGAQNLKFVAADAFEFSKKHRGEFDVVFEHTFFCAIDPARRTEVVEAWSRLLAPGGHLLGIFFIMDRQRFDANGARMPDGPPFGATEWEIRELLKSKFEFLYWTRWHHSIPSRAGLELVVYARKR